MIHEARTKIIGLGIAAAIGLTGCANSPVNALRVGSAEQGHNELSVTFGRGGGFCSDMAIGGNVFKINPFDAAEIVGVWPQLVETDAVTVTMSAKNGAILKVGESGQFILSGDAKTIASDAIGQPGNCLDVLQVETSSENVIGLDQNGN